MIKVVWCIGLIAVGFLLVIGIYEMVAGAAGIVSSIRNAITNTK